MIRTDEDLGRVKHAYVERREPGFIQLEEELPPHVFGLTIKLQNREPWFAENFPLAVENLLRPAEFRREFFTEMIKPPEGINLGYQHLARLMMRRLCWTVMTTNFDHNIIESLRELRPPIQEVVEINRTADDLVRFNIYNRCQVVYLHGAVEYYRDKDLLEEVWRLDDQLARRVRPIITYSPLIVIGYRGSEPSHHEPSTRRRG